MAQIRKTKRDEQNTKIASLTLENDTLLQSADIEQSRKDLAKAVVDFALQVISAEEFTGRDLRIYSLGIQEAVNKILKGEQAYSESMTGDAKTNIFGYYNPSTELNWMVNETVKRASNGIESSTDQQPVNVLQTPMRQYVKVTPAVGFNSYVLPNTTIDLKVKKFAAHLSNLLTNYILNPYEESKYIVEGINKDSIANFPSYITALNEISSRTATPEDILKIGDIVSALGNEELTNIFETYFVNELEGSDDKSLDTSPVQEEVSLVTDDKLLVEQPEIEDQISSVTMDDILQNIEELSDNDILNIFGGSGDKSGDINETGIFSDYTVSEMLNSAHPRAMNWDLKTRLAAFLGYYLLGEYDTVNTLFPNNAKETLATYTDDAENTRKLDLGNAFIMQLKMNPELYKRVLKLLLRTKIGTPEKTENLHKLVEKEILNIPILKNGGILKHVDGTFAGGVQNIDERNLQTAPKAVDILNLSTTQKWAIGLTAASILNDLTSIGTAYIPVAGPWISGAQAIAGMGADLATDIMTGQPARQTAINAGISGATGAAGLMAGAVKLAKAGLWAKRIGNIVQGVLGLASVGDLYSKIKDKNILKSWMKLNSPSSMTIQDWINVGHSLRALANVGTNISAGNRIWTDNATAPKNPTKKLLVIRNKNNKKLKMYKEVSTEALNKTQETSGKWWKIGENKRQRINQANELAGEGYEAVLGFRGKPRTVAVREIDPAKLAARQAQSDRFTPRALQKIFGYEGYNPGPKSGDKADEWNLNINLKLPGQTIKPTVVNKAKYNGKEIKIYGVTKQDIESGKISQIAPDLVRLSIKGWPKSVLDALPKGITEIWYSRKNGNIVYVSEPKINKNGGKLDKLQNYINNKNGN